MHKTGSQIIIQCHDNNIRKQMFIRDLSYSNDTYLQYNVQRKKSGQKIHMRSILQIGPIPIE